MSEYTRYRAIKHRVECAERLQSNLCDIHDLSISDFRYLIDMVQHAVHLLTMGEEYQVQKVSFAQALQEVEDEVVANEQLVFE